MKQWVKSPGVALIMALSVIMLLSVALMKSFENRTIETVHLENSLQRFQAETLSRSVLRAILIAIRSKGLLFFTVNKSSWQNVPIPLSETQYFQIQTIDSMDHLFNLNSRFNFKDDNPWPTVFNNLINNYLLSRDPLANDYDKDDSDQILLAFNDWSDTDSLQQIEARDNYEEYPDANPEFQVKNRAFDRLSEIRLIPAFRDLGIAHSDIRQRFRIYPIDSNDSSRQTVDINLVSVGNSMDSTNDIMKFLDQFKNTIKYPNIVEKWTDITKILADRDKELKGDDGIVDLQNPTPRYLGKKIFLKDLEQANIELNADEKNLFSIKTYLLSIRFSLTVLRTSIATEAVVRLEYADKLAIKNFEILELTMR